MRKTLLLAWCLACFAGLGSTGWGQTFQPPRVLWASDPATVPDLARATDAMIRTGELVPSRLQRDGQLPGRVHERLDQYHRGVRVWGGQIVWQKQSGLVHSVTGNLYESIGLDVVPTLSPEEAVGRGLERNGPGARVVGPVELVLLPLDPGFALAYSFRVKEGLRVDAFFVDAHSGSVLLRYDDRRSQSVIGLGIGRR